MKKFLSAALALCLAFFAGGVRRFRLQHTGVHRRPAARRFRRGH